MVKQANSTELRTVRVSDIAEYPTELGNRCLLLRERGLDPYRHTEEELMEALMESAEQPECLNICKKNSRCSAFFDRFQQGVTPFMERDPIRLLEYGGRYWVCEGKHRICLAKRAGIESIEAYVYPMTKDSYTLLPPEGKPGIFRFSAFYPKGRRGADGEAAVLWIGGAPGFPPNRFTLSPAMLDATQNTDGKEVSILPGISYRVLCSEERGNLLGRKKHVRIDSTVIIAPNHRKTRIWLLAYPTGRVIPHQAGNGPAVIAQGATLYRSGCWRNHHLGRVVSDLY